MSRAKTPLYIGTSRYVAALDSRTGEEIWRTKLSHGGSPVSLIVKGQCLYVGCGGYAYCLDKRTGNIEWENNLRRMGFQAVLLAMEGATSGSSQAAAATTEIIRQRRRAAAAGAAAAS